MIMHNVSDGNNIWASLGMVKLGMVKDPYKLEQKKIITKVSCVTY